MSTKTISRSVIATLLAIILNIIAVPTAKAQNLIKNPGFEEFLECPQDYGSFQDDLNSWYKPTLGSTDYFNKCGTKMKAGLNFIGKQESFEGSAYAGFYAYGPKDYREYVSGELIENMVEGKKYEFSFRVSLAEKSEFAVDELGILFSPTLLNLKTKRNITSSSIQRNSERNFVRIKSRKYLDDKDGWMEVSVEYVADGTEKYFILGNFNSNPSTRLIKVGSNLKKASYYYLDMVSLEEMGKSFKTNETIVLENLNFNSNGYQIQGDGTEQLQELVGHLKDNPALMISVYGHTDNLGTTLHNKELSQKRAKEVGQYLMDNGLSPVRISWRGFGDLAPLAQNETQEGRSKNRRVEFVISENNREFYASGGEFEEYK